MSLLSPNGRRLSFFQNQRRGLLKLTAVVLAPLSLGLGAAALSSQESGAATNPITVENANPGTAIPNTDPATIGQIEGYASAQSVNAGGSIGLHVSSSLGAVDLQVFRLGWYGGAKSRKMFSINGVAATAQPKPAPDAFGRVEAAWPVTYTLATAPNWASGIYVVGLFKAGAAVPTSLITFVVRSDASASQFLYVLPMNTYEAYNGWGGKSLYGYNSGGVPAKKVSFNRPFDSGSGAGLLFEGDAYMINFLEQEGYDVAYASSSDLNDNPGLLSNHRAFLSSFHDEYWSGAMRTNLENAISAGKHAAFFGANSVYWQVRYEPSSTGAANRTMVAYKESSAQDPIQGANTTGRFRDAPVNKPENALLGSQYEGDFTYGQSAPWVVANASHWMYNGTGLVNGDQIPKLVGYEWDRVFDNGQTPTNVVTLSNSTPQAGALQQATIHQKGGALVFNASTIYWPLLLANANWGIDTRVQTMTRNLLNAMIDPAGPPSTTLPPTTTVPPSNETVVTKWDFEDGTAQEWSNWYGTGTVTPVTTGAHGGTGAIRVTPGGYSVIVTQTRTLVVGQTYTFKAYLRNDAPTFAVGLVQFITPAGTSAAPDVNMVVSPDPTGNWKILSATFVMPAGAVTAQWGINGGDQAMVFDDAVVTTPAGSGVTTTIAGPTTTIAGATTTTVAAPTTTAPVSGSGCYVNYATTWDSGAGFGAAATVTNYGAPGTSWTLTWTWPNDQVINGSYGGTFTQTGNNVTFSNASWNGGIGNGTSADFGFGGSYTTGNTVPTAFRLNGTLCSTTPIVTTTTVGPPTTVPPATTTTRPAVTTTTIAPATTTTTVAPATTTTTTRPVVTTTTVPPTTTTTIAPGILLASWPFDDLRTTSWSGRSPTLVTTARTGTRALRSATGSLSLALNSYARSGRVNRVTAWVQSTAVPTAQITLTSFLSTQRINATIDAPVNGWRKVTVSYTPATLTTATFVLTTTGAIIVDDVEFRAL